MDIFKNSGVIAHPTLPTVAFDQETNPPTNDTNDFDISDDEETENQEIIEENINAPTIEIQTSMPPND